MLKNGVFVVTQKNYHLLLTDPFTKAGLDQATMENIYKCDPNVTQDLKVTEGRKNK